MLRKIRSKDLLLLALLLALVVLAFAPQPALAYSFTQVPTYDPYSGQVCPGMGLTRRMIPCIKENIVYAGNAFIVPFAAYLSHTVAIACTLAVMFWGLMVAMGKRDAPQRGAYVLGIKIAVVLFLSANYGNVLATMLDAMDDLLGVVSAYAVNYSSGFGYNPNCVSCPAAYSDAMSYPIYAIWDAIDCAIENMIGGIFSPVSLMFGILGFLIACVFSGAVGFFIAIAGAYLIANFLGAVARSVYIYVSSYLGFTLMMLIAPLFVPLILFTGTKPYFDKWARLSLVFFVQPIIIFGYLAMLIATYDAVIYNGPNSLYRAIAGNDVDNSCPFEIGQWLMANGAYSSAEIGSQAITVDPSQMVADVGSPQADPSGAMGTLEEMPGISFAEGVPGAIDAMGIGNNVNAATGQPDVRNFQLGFATTVVDWVMLANVTGIYDPTSYLVQLVICMCMAIIATYIMTKLLDSMPYLANSIAGAPVGMDTFGVGGMGMPGGGMVDKVRSKIADGFKQATNAASGGGKK